MKFNRLTDAEILRLACRIYFIWIFISILISVFEANKFSALFFDLPLNLRKLPAFFISAAYLIFFIPPVLLVILMGAAVTAFVLRRCL